MTRLTWVLSKLVEPQERASVVDATGFVDDYQAVARRYDDIETHLKKICKSAEPDCCVDGQSKKGLK